MTQSLASVLSRCAEFSVRDAHVSQHREVPTVSQNGSDSGDLGQVLTEQQTRLGIMVFSPACTVLYANQPAYHFLKVLNRRENGHATPGALPVSIADLFDQILKSLEGRIMNRDYEQLEARRMLVAQDQSVLVQAFGLSDRLGMHRSRVVITMREVFPVQEASLTQTVPPSG